MSNTPIDPSWWQASDGRWYPAHTHPQHQVASGPSVTGTPGSGPAEVAERWQKGVDGERATAAELMKLPPSFHIIHGLKKGPRNGDIDHLVIGPTGIWVIDSKNDSGVLTANKGTLWNGRYPISKKVDGVEDQARYANFALGMDVNPVLCFVQAQLPRPAQMIGRTRVVELGALSHHIMSGQTTMLPQQIQLAVERVGEWIRRPPAMGQRPPSSPPATAHRLRSVPTPAEQQNGSKLAPLAGILLTIVVLVGACGVVAMLAKRSGGSVGLSTTNATSTTLPAGARYIRVEIECPVPGSGFEVRPRTTINADRVNLSATVNGVPQYLGQFRVYEPIEPIRGLGPGSAIGFDVQLVDDLGQGGETHHFDITTPPSPC